MRGNSSQKPACSHGLPHIDGEGLTQFVTYRLFDALPPQARRETNAPHARRKFDLDSHDDIADRGYGSCLLARPECARIVVEQWNYYVPERYDLLAWVVMPNHVHVLIRARSEFRLPKIVQSWKVSSAKRMNEALERSGPIWQSDYFDHYLRKYDPDARFIDYIHMNPVKAGLATSPQLWPWSSAKECGELGSTRVSAS